MVTLDHWQSQHRQLQLVFQFVQPLLQSVFIRSGHHEPEVVGMLPGVVMIHARGTVNPGRHQIHLFFWRGHGSQQTGACLAVFKHRADPAENLLFLQGRQSLDNLFLGQAQCPGHFLVGAFADRQVTLVTVDQLSVCRIQSHQVAPPGRGRDQYTSCWVL